MIIKRKSLIVALISGVIVSLVLVLTLIGYLAYIELKGEEFKRSYNEAIQQVNAKVYSKHIGISKLTAKVENVGVLRGKPIIEGVIKNSGSKNITNLLISVKFLDRDGATVYEEAFNPEEPSLGVKGKPFISFSYLSGASKIILRSGESLPFKKILTSCPDEIIMVLRDDKGEFAKNAGRWSGKLVLEVLSVSF